MPSTFCHALARIVGMLALPLLSAPAQQAPRPMDRASSSRPSVAWLVDTLPPPFERPNGALLRPGSATYDLTIARAGQVTALGTRVVEVSDGQVNGAPAWVIAETRAGSVLPTVDSLYLTRGELIPMRWAATSGRAQLGASFNRDTVFGALQGYQGRSSFSLATTGHTLVTAGMVERIVELLPLAQGYRATTMLLVVEDGAPRLKPATLAVDHDESTTLGDHPVDCWVVALRTEQGEERLWVSKETPRVVKTEQAFAAGVLTAVLRVEPVAPILAPKDPQ